MPSKLTFVAVFCLSFLLISLWIGHSKALTKVPDVNFTTLKGQTITSSELRGKLVLVNFWATDCPTCLEEIPHLIDLHRQFAQRDLMIIAVAMHYDPPNRVLSMANSKQLPYAIALDPNEDLSKAFGHVQFTPTSFLIDREGHIILHKIGALEPAELLDKLSAEGLN